MPQDFDETLIEPFFADGFSVPLIRITTAEMPPSSDIMVGEQPYHYERSYPIKGHSAVMPGFLREQLDSGKQPLLIERETRFYVYLAA